MNCITTSSRWCAAPNFRTIIADEPELLLIFDKCAITYNMQNGAFGDFRGSENTPTREHLNPQSCALSARCGNSQLVVGAFCRLQTSELRIYSINVNNNRHPVQWSNPCILSHARALCVLFSDNNGCTFVTVTADNKLQRIHYDVALGWARTAWTQDLPESQRRVYASVVAASPTCLVRGDGNTIYLHNAENGTQMTYIPNILNTSILASDLCPGVVFIVSERDGSYWVRNLKIMPQNRLEISRDLLCFANDWRAARFFLPRSVVIARTDVQDFATFIVLTTRTNFQLLSL